jgi:Tol biopolymer transport system component
MCLKIGSFKKRFFSLGLVLFVLTILGLFVPTASAQYFGRNKVQYEKFDFRVLKTEHFDIYYYPKEQEAIEIAARMAERWYARLSRIMNYQIRSRQPLVVYASHPEFEQTTVISDIMGEGTGGVTESFKRRIIIPFGGSLEETDHVIGHELVHAFQYDITSQHIKEGSPATPTALRLPLWFIEGMAEYFSIGPVDPHTAMWMRDAAKSKKIPDIKKLENPRYFPYRYGQALLAYIGGRWGDLMIGNILKAAGRMGDWEKVMEKLLGVSIKQLSKDWHQALENSYTPIAQATQSPESLSRLLEKGSEQDPYNLAPAVSPDGKNLVFLSSRDLFSIEMYVTDVTTGKQIRRITKTATNPHYQSLQFIGSSGSWDSKGSRFVFGAISNAKPILALLNVSEHKVEKEIPFPQLGEILNPTWSPDDRRIAFTALVGGVTDLYIYDLETGELKRMTQDPYAELQPSWSPDGRSIAFVTDRFSTELSILSLGNYQLALMNPETGEIQQVPGFSAAKNIDPQWSSDSLSLYFLSDHGGISNIYRVDLRTQKISQVTNLYTGVSGITALSPAISMAHKANQLVYSAYEEGNYSIYSIESSEVLSGTSAPAQLSQYKASLLPPIDRASSEILGLLKNPLYGLPDASKFQIVPYNSKLTLDYVSQPQVALGVDRYGTYGAGGITLYWSDMLGYHTVATMAQTGTRLQDTAALVGYQNSRSRLNWGGVIQRIPYVYGGYGAGYDTVLGEPAYIEQEDIYRQINYQIAGFASYPFSQVQRFEISAGFQMIDFQHDVYTRAWSLYDDMLLVDEKTSLPTAKSMYFGYVGAAFVYDSSFFGATSPIVGQSYRFEVSPSIGSISFYSLLTDYRRYFMPLKPFTLAFRVLHYGRYGKGAEDERLYPMFMGYDGLLRGYDYGSFSMEEYLAPGSVFDRLFGSKMMIANAELRFPLFGALGVGKGFYGVLPIEFLAFYDAGVAWNSSDKLSLLKPLKSAGIGLRMNFFGYIIAGLNYVYPFDRPHKGWYLEFSIMPGF